MLNSARTIRLVRLWPRAKALAYTKAMELARENRQAIINQLFPERRFFRLRRWRRPEVYWGPVA